jgi:glycosyltransferase involved in cell wall biosynthesis
MPDISVVIPNYNNAAYLQEAIDSALAQEGVSLEVIVVDDGSTDHSRSVIESYGNRIQCFYQKNAGASAARNMGWQHANSKWIKFLDADDRLLPSVLSRQLARQAEWLRIDNRIITFTDGRLIDGSGNLVADSYYGEMKRNRQFTAAELVQHAPITPMPLFPKIALEQVSGFDPQVRSADEYDLEVRLQFAGWHFYLLDFVGYEYRVYDSDQRISRRRLSKEDFQNRYRTYLHHLQLATTALESPDGDELAAAFARIFWSTGRYALRCHEPESASQYFNQARLLSNKVPFGNAAYCFTCRCFGPKLAEKIARLSSRLS